MASKHKIGVAVVGVGRIGKTHLDAIQKSSDLVYLAAVVDVDQSRARAAAEQYGTKFYLSVEEALHDPDIEAAVVCLAHHLHTPVSLQIMEAGRHVLVEKPWALTVADGERMLSMAKERHVMLMAGQSLRFSLSAQEAKRRIVQGDIGNPFSILYEMAFTFEKANMPPWWQSVAKTGGLAFPMLGSHTVDFVLWMYEGKKPVRVYSETNKINPDFEGPDEIIILIRFDDSSMATLYLSHNTKPSKHEYLIVGPKGRIFCAIRGGHRSDRLVGMTEEDLFIGDQLIRSGPLEPHPYALQMREFADAIRQKREPIVKHSELMRQVVILEAAQKSAITHQPMTLK